METVLLVIGIAAVILLAVLIVIVLISNKNKVDEQYLARQISADISRQQSELRQELTAQTQNSVGAMGGMLEQRLQGFAAENRRSLDSIRDTVEKRLDNIQTDNARQLDEMRRTVDEKLNKSLDEKFSNSFSLVSQRLEQVYKGLGEMQNLAVGVGDLKKVLSNVKTRGILGEIQLGSILAEILSPTQYEENAATKQGSRNRVEFAVKLPADEGGFIYLPIDSKFPGDTYLALRDAVESGDKAQIEVCEKALLYLALRDAVESGDKAQIEVCEKALLGTIRNEAKDIHDKYIDPPHTTDFAVMFLPFEGLYSEVVNRGMVEELQHKYKVSIAGPSTMAALLNALQMGFRTLAVQKRSAEVWDVLRSVKKEFDSFADVLEKTQTRLDQANKELDNLVGVRTRQMQKQLAKVGTDEGIEN